MRVSLFFATVVLAALYASAVALSQGRPIERVVVDNDAVANVFRVNPLIYSGSGPSGAAAFQAIARLGANTIISVDGAKPDVTAAEAAGLRYVHIPIGYDGVPRVRVLQIAKAMRELPGPFYIHCHHGKHRGPVMAALAQLCADEQCTTECALALLRVAGTDPKYQRLSDSIRLFERPMAFEWRDAVLPSIAPVPSLTQSMVALDRHYEHLAAARQAGRMTPKENPDIDPAHETLQILEQFRELLRQPATLRKPDDFRGYLRAGEAAATSLESLLRDARGQKQTIPPLPTRPSSHSALHAPPVTTNIGTELIAAQVAPNRTFPDSV